MSNRGPSNKAVQLAGISKILGASLLGDLLFRHPERRVRNSVECLSDQTCSDQPATNWELRIWIRSIPRTGNNSTPLGRNAETHGLWPPLPIGRHFCPRRGSIGIVHVLFLIRSPALMWLVLMPQPRGRGDTAVHTVTLFNTPLTR